MLKIDRFFTLFILGIVASVALWGFLAKIAITEGPYVIGTMIADGEKAYHTEAGK